MDDDDETTYETPMFLCFSYLYFCLLVNETKNHNTLIVVDRYLRLMGDKTIPHSVEPRLKFVAGIDLPHQGVVDCYDIILQALWGHILTVAIVRICPNSVRNTLL